MSKDSTPEDGRYDARKRAKEMREKAIRAEARRGKVVLFSIIGGVVALALVVVLVLVNNAPDAGKVVYPKGLSGYATPVRGETAPKPAAPKVVIDIDFQCPICKGFEDVNGASLDALVASGDVDLSYQVRNFLGDYSSRAGNVAACVYDDNPKNYQGFVKALFAAQPSETAPDNTKPQSKDLLAMAKTAGAGDIAECVSTNKFGGYVNAANEDANTRSNGTPTVYINGKKLSQAEITPMMSSGDALATAIKAATKAS